MKLTEKEKEEMMRIANKRKRTKKEEWYARHFSGMYPGWKEDEDEE